MHLLFIYLPLCEAWNEFIKFAISEVCSPLYIILWAIWDLAALVIHISFKWLPVPNPLLMRTVLCMIYICRRNESFCIMVSVHDPGCLQAGRLCFEKSRLRRILQYSWLFDLSQNILPTIWWWASVKKFWSSYRNHMLNWSLWTLTLYLPCLSEIKVLSVVCSADGRAGYLNYPGSCSKMITRRLISFIESIFNSNMHKS